MRADDLAVLDWKGVERSQELLADILTIMKEGRAPEADIFLDSPLAIEATEVFRHRGWNRSTGVNPFEGLYARDRLKFLRAPDESDGLDRLSGWHIILAASGMCDAGRVRKHLKRLLWRKQATVLLAGYQAVGTLGRFLQEGAARVRIEGEDLSTLDEHSRAELRRNKIGFIFQAFGLIPILSAVENVEIPLRMVGAEPSHRRDRSRQLLERVGLADRASHFPEELSGGEQQRVAIARALANDPILLIADEPTGQLDSRTGQSIVGLIRALVHDQNIAAVAATHDPALLAIANRVIELRDGEMVSDVLARAL